MSAHDPRSLVLDVVPVSNELKEQDLERMSAGLDKVGSLIPSGFPMMSFPSINIPSFGS